MQSGNFAFVFKFEIAGGKNTAIKCFRQDMGDRELRYKEITACLDRHDLSVLPHFDYDQTGILVGNERYPVLMMDWIVGNTLDVYVEKIIDAGKSADALVPLAKHWAELVKQLEDANVAHGDLQHGNVIVSDNGLRLVDLDGMFVPSLRGFPPADLGHDHFRPPWRNASQFDAAIDRFPALVIYVSLVALSRLPQLWNKYHDDNLIFTKDDFREPAKSSLFKELGGSDKEVASLAQILAEACVSPSKAPSLASLVQPKISRLPAWMRDEQIIHVEAVTREPEVPHPTAAEPVSAAPSEALWWKTATVPTPASTSAATQTSPAPPTLLSGREVLSQTAQMAFRFGVCGLSLIWMWMPLFRLLLAKTGAAGNDIFVTVLLYVWGCVCVGLGIAMKSYRLAIRFSSAQSAMVPQPSSNTSFGGAPTPYSPAPPAPSATVFSPSNPPTTAPSPIPARKAPSSGGTWVPTSSGTAPSPTTSTPAASAPYKGTYWPGYAPPVVASTIRLIYHRQSCSWAFKISARNRISFPSAAAATAQGDRPCRVCSPY